jgi:hypothetical protein
MAHFGLRAMHTRRPCQMQLVGELNPFVLRDDFHQVLLDLLGFLVCGEFQAVGEALYVECRQQRRWRLPYAVPSTTLPVFLATPGRVRISSIVRGTSPPNFSTTALLAPITDFVLLRKNPVGRISCSSSEGFA